MGLAVLPGRLEKELKLIAAILTGEKSLEQYSAEDQESLEKHLDWIHAMQETYGIVASQEEAEEILRKEVGRKFSEVLECAGVYKNTPEGHAAIDRFMTSTGCVRS